MLRIGEYVKFHNDNRYFGHIIGARKSNDGWWVLDRTGKSMGAATATLKRTGGQMTEEVWNALVGVNAVAWYAWAEHLVLFAQPPKVSAPPAEPVTTSTQHVAGLSPESIDWDAHRAFFRGGM